MMKLNSFRKPRFGHFKKGFSLAEVSVGMGVVGIVFISLYSGLTSGMTSIGMSRENARATQVMAEKLDSIRLYSWDKIVSLGNSESSFKATFSPTMDASDGASGVVYEGKVRIDSAPVHETYKDNMRQVTVSLSWKTGSIQRNRSMTTLVAKDGMQNYIY